VRRIHETDELLEPLPVDDDGVMVQPLWAEAPAPQPADPRRLAAEYAAAFRAVLRERSEVRTQPPWTVTTPTPATVRPAVFHSSFSRMVGVSPTRLVGFQQWWEARERDGEVRVTRRLSLERPRPASGGTWRTNGRLRIPWGIRSIPVELLLWPYLGGWTKVLLEPRRAVHANRWYFRRGHRVLDALTTRLAEELQPAT
jgi:hypothetical protein